MPTPQVFSYDGFGGGLNLAVSSRDIADDELAEATNVEIVGQSDIRSRGGLTSLASSLAGAVTSIFHYRAANSTECVVFTAGDQIYRIPVGGGAVVNVTGGLTLPSSGVWQWAVLNDKCIGVNRGTGANANPVVLDSPADLAAAALGGSPPKALYVEVFDSRLWVVSALEPNRLHYCMLGDPTDWTTVSTAGAGSGSILVGANEGDHITGIRAHLGRLFIFKRTRIYVLTPGSPTTDSRQWTVPMLTDRVGCVAGHTIQSVLGDLVFLSDHGVVTLQAAEQAGDFAPAALSYKIPDLRECNKNVVGLSSVMNPEKLQYWVGVAEAGQTSPNVTWVMDYTGLGSGGVAWTKFTGGVVGTAYGLVYESGRPRVYVGNSSGLFRYADDDVFTDNGTLYEKVVRTKAFSPGPALWRKEFFRYGMEFEVETDDGQMTISYLLDESDGRMKTVTITFGDAFSGGRWDEGLWDTATFATEGHRAVDFMCAIRGTVGRRGQTLQFRLYNKRADGFRFKRLTLDALLLTRNHSGDVEL
jgi:hypothetical protein